MITHFDGFAGMGGFTKAFKNVFGKNYKNVGFSEVDKHSTACYQYNFPKHKNYGDITLIQPGTLPDFDIFTGGFPCQTFSIAGKRQGFEDTRGTLFFEIARICAEKKPKLLVLENVQGLLNHDSGRTFSTIYRVLADIGYTIEFQLLNTRWLLPQNRERIFIIGHLGRECKPRIFPFTEDDFLLKSKKIAKKIQSQAKHHSTTITGKMRATDTYVSIPKIAGTLTAGANSGGLHSDMTIIEVGIFRTHEDGKGFRKIEKDICPTIPARARKDGSGQPVINVYSLQPRTGDPTKGGTGLLQKSNESYCLDTGNSMAIEFENKIRRLTEIECERLQGFPDNWTKFGSYDNEIKPIPKTQRYKMIGNAVTVDIVELIAKKL